MRIDTKVFWYRRETIEGLIKIASDMSDQRKRKISIEFGEKTNVSLTFSKNDVNTINGNEILFINCIYKYSGYKKKTLLRINGYLKKSQLEYIDGKIINKQGAYSIISEEYIGDKKFIRKTVPIVDIIQTEYFLLYELNKYKDNKDYVIKIIDAVFDDKSFLMECASDSLENYILNNKNISNGDREKIVLRVLDSVNYIHIKGIIHRDLHPGNILLIRNDVLSSGTWKLSDFGFACSINKIKEYRNGVNRKYYGRMDYTAPEQLNNLSDASIKSDIFSLGRLINFIMTKNCKSLKHRLCEIARKCTLINKDKRYNSVMEIINDINTTIK